MAEIEITRPCYACSVGLYEECEHPEDLGNGFIIPCINKFDIASVQARTETSVVGGGGGLKDSKEITDIVSTGRKRAAMLAPIMTGMTCEWSGLKFAGGGIQPIVGCRGTRLAAVKRNEDLPQDGGKWSRGELQHGPDKSTLNNAVGQNLHRICSSCHHRWHELNDAGYEGQRPDAHLQWVPNVPYYAHDSQTVATDEDYEASEAWWATEKSRRGEYPIELPENVRLLEPAEQGILTGDNPFEEPLNPFTDENGDTP